jgi:HAD superfamily hydrolase (TIGR01662 family)
MMDAPSSFRYLLFDLGGTLMHSRGEWGPVLAAADDALVNVLARHHVQLNAKLFRTRLHEYYTQRDQDLIETTYHFVLRQLLAEQGYAEVDESTIRSALDALYAVTQTNWQLEEGAAELVADLRARGHHLGILSNAGDDKDVQELVHSFGIHSHFDFVLTSAACYYRKPHVRSFEFALAHWDINPEDAVMIGDSLLADIDGANSLNMRTIWIQRYAQFSADEFNRITPTFKLPRLNEFLSTLKLD